MRIKNSKIIVYLLLLGRNKTLKLMFYFIFSFWLIIPVELFSQNKKSSNYNYNLNKKYRSWETIVYTGNLYDLDELEEKIIQVIEKNPSDPFGYYLMSCMYLRKVQLSSSMDITGIGGSYLKKSMELTQNLVESYPRLDLGYISMAESLSMLSQGEQAKLLLQESLVIIENPSWRIYFELSKIYFETDPKKASAYLQQALSFKDSNIDILVPELINIYLSWYPVNANDKKIKDKNINYLIKEFKHWNSIYPHDAFLEKIGSLLVEQKKYQLAHSYLNRAYKKKKPEYLYAALLDSKIMYDKLNEMSYSKKLLTSILNLKYIDKYPHVKAMASLYMGHISLISKNLNEAKKYFSQVLTQNYEDEFIGNTFLTNIYDMYKGSSNVTEYTKFITELLDNNYLSSFVYVHLSRIYSQELNDHESGMEYITDALILDPSKPDYYVEAGIILYRMKDLKKASSMFELAYKLNPMYATARYNYACTMALMGDLDSAYLSLQKAVSLDPSLYLTALTDTDLSKLKEDPRFDSIEDTYTKVTSNESSLEDLDLENLDIFEESP